METKRTFKTAELKAWGLPHDPDDGIKILKQETHNSDRRWEDDVELIFALSDTPDGYGWQVWYCVGKTENQDTRPWEFDETVNAQLVHEVEVTVKQWMAAK